MRKILLHFMVLLSAMFVVQNALASTTDWGYTKSTGPSQWGIIGYPLCEDGKQQSPINITNAVSSVNNALAFHYESANFTRKRDAHNLYAYALDQRDYLEFNGQQYKLQSLHFHTPAEHEIMEKQYPFEGHFIHQSSSGKILVVGVFFKVGKENKTLEKILGTPKKEIINVDIAQLLTGPKAYYVYSGSLTTPPCTEGLTWVVLANPIELSEQQLQFFREVIMQNNSRPPQPLNNRVVTENASMRQST